MIGIRLTYRSFAHVYMWIGGLAHRVLTCDPKLPSSDFACGKLSILATKRRMRYLQLNVGRQADDGHVRSVIRLITRSTRSCTFSRPVRRPVGAPHHTSLQYSNTSLRKLTLNFLRMFDGMWCLYASRFNRFTAPETRFKNGETCALHFRPKSRTTPKWLVDIRRGVTSGFTLIGAIEGQIFDERYRCFWTAWKTLRLLSSECQAPFQTAHRKVRDERKTRIIASPITACRSAGCMCAGDGWGTMAIDVLISFFFFVSTAGIP